MRVLALALLLVQPAAGPAAAESVVATRAIPAQTVIGPGDVALVAAEIDGAADSLAGIVGQEARGMLYPGRPVRPGDVGPPAVVDRNQIVTLHYRSGALSILAEGRALDRAAAGERVRALNLASRSTVSGTVQSDGSIDVTPGS
jgi:flagella basal body P-ring formation protein FlgA